MVRLTDHLDMTLAVDWGVKQQTKQTKCMYGVNKPLVRSAYQKIIFFFLNQNICFGYSNEQSQ